MNTPAHLIIGAAAFARPDSDRVTLAALTGALLPDLSLYMLAGWHLIVLETPARVVFGELYYSSAWQRIFGIDNSFVLWGIACGIAFRFRSRWGLALTGSALLHLALDFPFHTHDARMHFWPLTDWKFHSPMSYWDGARGGDIIGWIEMSLVTGLTTGLFWRFRRSLWRWLFLIVAGLQITPFFLWRWVF